LFTKFIFLRTSGPTSNDGAYLSIFPYHTARFLYQKKGFNKQLTTTSTLKQTKISTKRKVC